MNALKACQYCGKNMIVAEEVKNAQISHLSCAMAATKEAREKLALLNSKNKKNW